MLTTELQLTLNALDYREQDGGGMTSEQHVPAMGICEVSLRLYVRQWLSPSRSSE